MTLLSPLFNRVWRRILIVLLTNACGSDGVLNRLAEDGKNWLEIGKLRRPRFFHRLLPGHASQLLAIGGASPTDGHLADTELFDLATLGPDDCRP